MPVSNLVGRAALSIALGWKRVSKTTVAANPKAHILMLVPGLSHLVGMQKRKFGGQHYLAPPGTGQFFPFQPSANDRLTSWPMIGLPTKYAAPTRLVGRIIASGWNEHRTWLEISSHSVGRSDLHLVGMNIALGWSKHRIRLEKNKCNVICLKEFCKSIALKDFSGSAFL